MIFSRKKIFSLAIIFLIAFDSCSSKFLDGNLISFAESDAVATITTDSESDLLNAVKTLNSNGGTIYINTPVISISTTSTIKLTGTNPGGLVGMKLSDGTYPRLDFTKEEMQDQQLEV